MGVEFAASDSGDDVLEAAVGRVVGDETVDEALAGEGEHLVARLLHAVTLFFAGGVDVRAVLIEGVDQPIDALLLRTRCLQDRHLPVALRAPERLVDRRKLTVEEICVKAGRSC